MRTIIHINRQRIDLIEGVRENNLGLQSLYEEQKYGSKIEDI